MLIVLIVAIGGPLVFGAGLFLGLYCSARIIARKIGRDASRALVNVLERREDA